MDLRFIIRRDREDDTYAVLAPEPDGTLHLIAHVGACDCLGVPRLQYARLLRSAPELLAQCQRLYAHLTRPDRGAGAEDQLLQDLLAVITKAKGDERVYNG